MIRFFILWNIAVFVVTGIDKMLAIGGGRRLSESTLLLAALFGGAPGLWAGMLLFRHKTQKKPFVIAATLAGVTSVVLFALARSTGL